MAGKWRQLHLNNNNNCCTEKKTKINKLHLRAIVIKKKGLYWDIGKKKGRERGRAEGKKKELIFLG